MTWRGRAIGWAVAVSASVVLGGCVAHEPVGVLPQSRDTPFLLDVPQAETTGVIKRGQQAELLSPQPLPPVTFAQSSPAPALPQLPPLPGQLPPPSPGQLPPPSPGQSVNPTPGLQTVGLMQPSSAPATVTVKVWVNGKPIFQDEVWNLVGNRPQFNRLPPAQQEITIKNAIDLLIDSELLMQDALAALAKNEKALESVKTKAYKEYDKNISENMRRQNIATLDEFKVILQMQGTTLESIRRHMERDFISNIYLRSKLETKLAKVGGEEIRDFYNQHLNEFMQVDRVKWQDICIAVGPKHPTMADARKFAEQIRKRWTGGEDISKLLEFDDGLGAVNKGAGVGEIKGDIRPVEIEPFLFAMKDGEFSQVELSTGVHVFRMLHREHAGPMPFDEKTQTTIGNKLKNEIVEQERKRIVRLLRERAIIQIEPAPR